MKIIPERLLRNRAALSDSTISVRTSKERLTSGLASRIAATAKATTPRERRSVRPLEAEGEYCISLGASAPGGLAARRTTQRHSEERGSAAGYPVSVLSSHHLEARADAGAFTAKPGGIFGTSGGAVNGFGF